VYTLADPSVIKKGWNHISVTNDADVADSWLAYDAQLVIKGEVTGAIKSEFAFASGYDGSTRHAAYKVPAGYSPNISVPLLVSIGGSGEDRWDALYHYAERANAAGWLLVAPDVRRVNRDWGGRTASLATQHDVIDAIEHMVKRFAVDVERIYMSGFSAGGGVAATVAAKYPHVFAAVVDWIGPTDLLEWAQQRPELCSSLVANDFGCPAEGGETACPFEWQRRSARFLVMNLKHVPLAIVHGRADDVVPFAQSEDFYRAMHEFYDPKVHHKVAVWHDGGHFDPVPSLRPLIFLEPYRVNATPQDITIRADESKDYYWIRIVQKDWKGQRRDGFTSVAAIFDSHTGVISVTVQDERLFAGGNLPVDVTIDLARIGFDPTVTYVIEHLNLATGTWAVEEVMPVDGRLLLTAPRDASGQVSHRYEVHLLGSGNGGL
jgi:poly(3-hydroxybutyrate) depolymerase